MSKRLFPSYTLQRLFFYRETIKHLLLLKKYIYICIYINNTRVIVRYVQSDGRQTCLHGMKDRMNCSNVSTTEP